MKTSTFDLVVIGSGPAGQRAALQGAKAGKKVAIVEAFAAVGGNCVYSGTLPSKSFRESVYRWSLGSQGALGQELEHAEDLNQVQAKHKKNTPDMSRLLRRRDRVVRVESQVILDQLNRNGISIVHGKGRFKSATEVEVDNFSGTTEILKSSFIFIATGSGSVIPQNVNLDAEAVLDSESILSLTKIPKSMICLGAGVIGCEYASMFGMAGTKIYLVDVRDEILGSVDRELVGRLIDRFRYQGTEIVLDVRTESVNTSVNADGSTKVEVALSNGKVLESEIVLVSAGRKGNIDGLCLENAGLAPDERGLIEVDSDFRTKIPTVFAVGDVIGPPALASTSIEQGRIACCRAFNIEGETSSLMPDNYPFGIYTIPEISIIGLTEKQVKEKDIPHVVGRGLYKELARGQIVGDWWGLLKLIVHAETQKILGVHIVGDNAADLIHIGQAVMQLDGDVNYFIRNVFNYPTFAEAYKTAAFHAVNQLQGNQANSHA